MDWSILLSWWNRDCHICKDHLVLYTVALMVYEDCCFLSLRSSNIPWDFSFEFIWNGICQRLLHFSWSSVISWICPCDLCCCFLFDPWIFRGFVLVSCAVVFILIIGFFVDSSLSIELLRVPSDSAWDKNSEWVGAVSAVMLSRWRAVFNEPFS